MNCSTSLSISIISSSQNLSIPHIERYSFVDNVILENNKNITFHSCHRKETSAYACTMSSSVKVTASKQRIQPVATTAAEVSEVDVYATAASLAGSKRSVLNLWRDLFPKDGALPSEPSVSSLKAPSRSESARASFTASDSASASASTVHCVGDDGGLSLSGR